MRNPQLEKIRRRLFKKLVAVGFQVKASRCVRVTTESIQTVSVRRDPLERLCIEISVSYPRLDSVADDELRLFGDLMADHSSFPNLVESAGKREDFELNEEERVTIWTNEQSWDEYLQFMLDHRIIPFLDKVATLGDAADSIGQYRQEWAVIVSARFRNAVLGESRRINKFVGNDWVWSGSVVSIDDL